MLVVHHLSASQSDRIVWLCEELEIPYELRRYDRDPTTRLAPADYKALSPFGTAPVITDGDLVLGESAAIVDYVISTYGNGRLMIKPGQPNYPEYLFWFHFANGSMVPSIMLEMVAARFSPDGKVPANNPLSRLDKAYDLLEARLGQAPYLAGNEFTAADLLNVFPLTTMRLFMPRDLGEYPNIKDYVQRIAARPAFRRAMAKADPDLQIPVE
jgi:glutathione S-transferase